MAHGKRQDHNRPNRRIAPMGTISDEILSNLNRARYVGSPKHKSRPADYGFQPPVSPRWSASLCDDRRPVPLREATRLFRAGIRLGMMSKPLDHGLPKFVWSVDDDGEAYEAILGSDGPNYHGYRLKRGAANRAAVIAEWNERSKAGYE